MKLWLTVGILEVAIEKIFGELEGHSARTFVLHFGYGQRYSFADDALKQGLTGPNHVGCQNELGIRSEVCLQLLLWQINAVPNNAGKGDLERRALFDGCDARHLLCRLDGSDLRFRGEVEWDAHDVGI